MKLKIQRSTDSKNALIEISSSKTNILLDGGINLEENEVLLLPDLQAQYDFSGISAVFLSHYRTDHITMARGLLENVPVYAGKLAAKMGTAAEKYKAKKAFEFAGFYQNGSAIMVGDIKVTPFLVDDIAHEGYLLLIEAEGKSILYTGDYRANGRKSFEEMLKNLPAKVDVLLCEDGVITDADVNPVTERDLEEAAAKLIGSKKGPVFVLQSVTDFDRAATIFYAAKRNKRVYLEDLYMCQIAGAAEKAMPNPAGWTGARAYLTSGYKEEHFRYKMFTELPRLNKAEIEKQNFVMCIRTSMKKYMKTLSQGIRFEDGLIINALPDESAKSAKTQEFLAFAVEKGLESVTIRNSGHANAMALKALIKAVKPVKIVPLATQNVRWLKSEYSHSSVLAEDTIEC